jgi:uncharacterized protein (TIGR03792 family)
VTGVDPGEGASVDSWTYIRDEKRPVEVLVFEMDPSVVDEFLGVDHEVWTIGEALLPGFERIPFLSKDVWLDDSRPGRVTLVFVWESREAWQRVDAPEVQGRLQAEFRVRFPHPVRLVEAWHEETNFGLRRWSRFERREPPGIPAGVDRLEP